MESRFEVDVCICTYRRASVVQTLQSLAGQTLPRGTFGVIVCDNDVQPSGKALVEAAARELDLPVTYVHAPSGNISIARNACLEASTAPFLAFIDDDSTADPHWLEALLDAARVGEADVVFGPVNPTYPPDAPAWVVAADMHATRTEVPADGQLKTGHSGNSLIRRAVVGDERFDLALGRSGGEDTVFFDRLRRRGAVLRYCETATMSEEAPLSRLKLRWLLKRSFRSGQTHARLLMEHGRQAAPEMALAALKAAACLGMGVLNIGSPVGWRRALVRGALHVGVVARLSGLSEPALYGAATRGAGAAPNSR